MKSILDWISKNPTLAGSIIAAISGVIGGFLTVVVWPIVQSSLHGIWKKVLLKLSGNEFEAHYLDWIINEHQYLPTLPTTLVPVTAGQHQQELDNLYVSLGLVSAQGKKHEVTLSDQLVNKPKLIIIGDPGAGKTTMLRFLALTFARARRLKSRVSRLTQRREMRRKILIAHKRVKDEFKLEKLPLPVFLYLNRLRSVTEWPKGYSILDAIRDDLKAIDILRHIPIDFFEEKLQKGECVFLFDAFDELGTQMARQAIAKAVGELANSAPSGNRFIVTSRIIGYNGQLGQYGFDVLEVQQLSWSLIQQLVRSWYALLKETALGDQLLATLRANTRIYELAVNPMLLSLIVLVQYVRRLIPDRRHVLYDECIKILVERRYAPPDVQAHYNQVVPGDEAIRILQRVALEMHKKRLREITRAAIEKQLLPEVLGSMPKSRAAGNSAVEVLRNIEERSQLMVERGLNEMGEPLMAFSHLTFQEYLASVALKERTGLKGESFITGTLLTEYQSDRDWWEEVALLYAAQLDPEQQNDFFQQLYPPSGAFRATS